MRKAFVKQQHDHKTEYNSYAIAATFYKFNFAYAL